MTKNSLTPKKSFLEHLSNLASMLEGINFEIDLQTAKPSISINPGEILLSSLKRPIEDRIREIVNEIAFSIEEKINESNREPDEIINDPKFIDTLFHAIPIVMRNHQEEIRKALKNLVVNTALSPSIDETYTKIFLRFLDEFSEWHIKLLDLFDNPENWGERNNHSFPSQVRGGNYKDIAYHAFPSLKKDENILFQIWNDLARQRLIKDVALTSGVISTKPEPMFKSITTTTGKEFLNYIRESK